METGEAKVKVRLGSGRVVEVVPLRRAWQPRFFLVREADNKPVLMIHETQVVWEQGDAHGLARTNATNATEGA
jgi:hypothetical protein